MDYVGADVWLCVWMVVSCGVREGGVEAKRSGTVLQWSRVIALTLAALETASLECLNASMSLALTASSLATFFSSFLTFFSAMMVCGGGVSAFRTRASGASLCSGDFSNWF